MHFKSRFIGLNTHQPKPRMSSSRPELGRKDSPVILSAAKDLAAPFTPVLCCSEAETVILSAAKDLAAPFTPILCCSEAGTVILSAAKDLAAPRARPFTALRVTWLGHLG